MYNIKYILITTDNLISKQILQDLFSDCRITKIKKILKDKL